MGILILNTGVGDVRGGSGVPAGRETAMLLEGFHGVAGRPVAGGVWGLPEMYLAYDRDLAEAYAEGGPVLAVAYEARNPLVLDTPGAFCAAWRASGAHEVEGPFHPVATGTFAVWARRAGYDAICVPASAFEGEDGYAEVGGTLGDPQMILLEPRRATWERAS